MAEYATVEQLRDEGVSVELSDARLTLLLKRAALQIENWTGRWFYPKHTTFLLDGTGSDQLQVGPPIILIESVRWLEPDTTYLTATNELVDLRSIRVYNRHLTQGLLDPDDRKNPKLQYVSSWSGERHAPRIFPSGWWPEGVQNIEVKGLFGWTEPDDGATLWTDGVTPIGTTPAAITLATLMLAVRDTLPLGDLEGRNEAALANRLQSLRTRDQSISWGYQQSTSASIGDSNAGGAGIAGNSLIKSLLQPYVRMGALGAV